MTKRLFWSKLCILHPIQYFWGGFWRTLDTVHLYFCQLAETLFHNVQRVRRPSVQNQLGQSRTRQVHGKQIKPVTLLT